LCLSLFYTRFGCGGVGWRVLWWLFFYINKTPSVWCCLMAGYGLLRPVSTVTAGDPITPRAQASKDRSQDIVSYDACS
jgi:hypothetical protein